MKLLPTKISISLFLFFQFTILFGQSKKAQRSIDLLNSNLKTYPQEKIFVHHDRPNYVLGDEIFYKLYLVNATSHLEQTPSTLVHVELIDPENKVVERQHIKMIKGQDHGSFRIKTDWVPGDYHLRAYSNYQRNYNSDFIFSKSISIAGPNKATSVSSGQSTTPSIKFYPEGGHLINGLNSVVAFEALDNNGHPINFKGIITKDGTPLIDNITPKHEGLGFLQLTPNIGAKYKAEITYNNQVYSFDLPKIQEQGYSIFVNNRKKDNFSIQLGASEGKDLKGGYIIGHLRGEPYIFLDQMKGQTFSATLGKSDIPAGILHLTFFDKSHSPQLERLIYIDNDQFKAQMDIDIKNDFCYQKSNCSVNVSTGTNDIQPAAANLSVAIIDKSVIDLNQYDQNIHSYLLFESDLASQVNDPRLYLENNSKSRFLQDLLLLTKGWRRFNISEISKEPTIKFPPESGLTISGYLTAKGKPQKKIEGQVILNYSGEQFQMLQMETKEDGRFVFDELNIPDSTAVIVQGSKLKKRKRKKDRESNGSDGNRNVDLILDEFDAPIIDYNTSSYSATDTTDNDRLYRLLKNKANVERSLAASFEVELENVTIKGKRQTENQKLGITGALYNRPSDRLIIDSIKSVRPNQTVYELIRARVSGIQIFGTGDNTTVLIRGSDRLNGSNAARFLVDGVAVEQSYINTLTADRIKAIDVLKGLAQTSIYGEYGSNGIIAIWLRDASDNKIVNTQSFNGIINFTHPGFFKAREFYMPDYMKNPNNQGLPDIRPTLYWNPSVILGKEKESLNFYGADIAAQYLIVVQGITNDGRTIYATETLEIK